MPGLVRTAPRAHALAARQQATGVPMPGAPHTWRRTLLDLHSSIGNRAVGRLVGRPPAIQRIFTHEGKEIPNLDAILNYLVEKGHLVKEAGDKATTKQLAKKQLYDEFEKVRAATGADAAVPLDSWLSDKKIRENVGEINRKLALPTKKAQPKKAQEKKAASKVGTDDISDEIIAFGTEIFLDPGTRLYRMGEGFAARQYVISGPPTTHNEENWTQLGPGFYTGTRDTALGYAAKMKGLPVLMEFEVRKKARGLQVNAAGVLDGIKIERIAKLYKTYDFIYLDEAQVGVQWKFHAPFYKESLEIVSLSAKEGRNSYKQYTPKEFVIEFEKYIVGKHQKAAEQWKQEQLETELKRREESLAGASTSEALLNAPSAEPYILEAIEYLEAAERFEERLSLYILTLPAVSKYIALLVKVAWELFNSEAGRVQFGTGDIHVTGMVGTELARIERVVTSGNLREQMAFLYNGYVNRLFESRFGAHRFERPAALAEERKERRSRENESGQALKGSDVRSGRNPLAVQPPLSEAEWFTSVGPTGQLFWQPGEKKYEFQMVSKLQRAAEGIGALIKTGTSGTAYGILQAATALAQTGSLQLDLKAVRLALLAWMLQAGDHTFHEIMIACQNFDSTLRYENGYRRYRLIEPLTESELQQNVATNDRFPDEVIRELREIRS